MPFSLDELRVKEGLAERDLRRGLRAVVVEKFDIVGRACL